MTGPRVVVLSVDGGRQRPESWLTANQRRHFRDVASGTKAWRTRALAAAREQAAGVAFTRARVVVHVFRPNLRRYDPGNWAPTAKACVDGLVDAHLIPDDDWRHLDGPDMRHGGINRDRALVTITITDLGDPL